MPLPKKVFIVEDHPVFRQGLAQMVNDEEGFIVCGHTGEADHARDEIARLEPDIVLVDLSLEGKNGLDLIKEVRAKNRKVKLLVVSMHDEALYAERVLRAGGNGYIMKQEDPEEIINAMRDVIEGHLYVSDAVLASASERSSEHPVATPPRALDLLTDSELEILELIGKGKSVKDIGRQLRLNESMINTHRAQIRKKLNLKSVPELIRYAVCWVETGVS
ncbi:MAG TPA: response regulator transcription factor [Verrucomicrobiae bacterium]|nr:response regulator transcription factor [Verrucomicrobiae bacterium]